MSNPAGPDFPELHHFPPTTADWVTSPLGDEDQLPQNPLEPARAGRGGQRLGALLVIVGGLVAIAALFLQFAQMSAWYGWAIVVAILVAGAAAMAVAAAVRGITLLASSDAVQVDQAILLAFGSSILQIIVAGMVVVLLVTGNRQILGTSGTAVAMADALCLLLGGSVLRFIVRPHLSGLEVAEQAEKDQRMVDFTRGRKGNKTFVPWR